MPPHHAKRHLRRMAPCSALLLLFLVSAVKSAWMARPFPRARQAGRACDRLRCCAEPADFATDLDAVCLEACTAVRGDLLRGKRGMRIDVGLPSLDPGGRMYEPEHLARVCLELSKTLALLEGRVLVLLPGFTTSGAAMSVLENDALDWPADFRERVSVSSADE